MHTQFITDKCSLIHHRRHVTQHCTNSYVISQWQTATFDPWQNWTPLTDYTKLSQLNTSAARTTNCAKFRV